MYKVAKLRYLWQFTWENYSFFVCMQGNSFEKRAYTYLRRPWFCKSERLAKGTNLRNRQKNRKIDGEEEADGIRKRKQWDGGKFDAEVDFEEQVRRVADWRKEASTCCCFQSHLLTAQTDHDDIMWSSPSSELMIMTIKFWTITQKYEMIHVG